MEQKEDVVLQAEADVTIPSAAERDDAEQLAAGQSGRAASEKKPKKVSWKKDFMQNWQVYTLFIPAFVFFLLMCYVPMFGIVMAFEDFRIVDGIFGSEWVWFDNFIELFTAEKFWQVLGNTVVIALLKITIQFVAPIIFALLLSLLRSKKYKRTVQTLSYMPNFVAAVVICSLFTSFFGLNGVISTWLTGQGADWIINDQIPVFWLMYTFMGIWQGIGWGSIMYVASISMVNGDLHEAAALDGATRLQRLWYITLPCISPMIVMMFVMNVGLSFTTGFDNILLLYAPKNYNVADTLYTYTYRLAFDAGNQDYALSAASGLFQSVVGTILLVGSNKLSKKLSGSSLF